MDRQDMTVELAGEESVAPDPASPAAPEVRPTSAVATTEAASAAGAHRFPYHYVYAIGRIAPRFPRLAVEKEFAQVAGRADTAGLTDPQVLHSVLAQRENRYLARQLCYVLTIEGLDTYILQPQDPLDVSLLVDAIRPEPSAVDVDVVIGILGPVASPDVCNGLMVPVVAVEQTYSFDRQALIGAIPRPPRMTAKQFEPAAADVFDRIIQLADNAGATDAHRAANYVAVRYPTVYAKAAEQHTQDFSLSAVDVYRSPLSGGRVVMELVFSYTHRNTDFTEKFFVRVDVTEEFPFLVTKLSPYYDR